MKPTPRFSLAILVVLLTITSPASAFDVRQCSELWRTGSYEKCIAVAEEELAGGTSAPERVSELKARSEAALGRYSDACATLQTALLAAPGNIQLRWLLIELAPYADLPELVDRQQRELEIIIGGATGRYTRDCENLVTLARFALKQGADPRQIQEVMLRRARLFDPRSVEPDLFFGEVALEKRDFAVAADSFKAAGVLDPDHPGVLYGMAMALRESDLDQTKSLLTKLLTINSRHAGALSTLAEFQINAEQYSEAMKLLDQILETNPHHPEALAMQAAILFIQGKEEDSTHKREQALETWKKNPRVDFLIGRILSQKYRFKEGAAAQRRALEFATDYLPSRKQLAVDLLRLGNEEEGWQLADSVYQQDQYDVASYNLITLRDELDRFATTEIDGLIIRMEKEEFATYGTRVIDLLTAAKSELCKKYNVQLPEKVLVEIFPNPSDFAVRTFGMPGAGGYLGVCFGNVVTARSPASQSTMPNNWESVLWHEFAHVITLNKTHNRMPRWLSEGISVYEERQKDSLWGERMTLAYSEMILNGELTPISQLSGAFLSPKSSQHLMFAYYESSCVVEHLIENYGMPALHAILDDLAVGMEINEAIERHTAPMAQLEEEFEISMKRQVRNFRWYVDWEAADFSEILDDPAAATKLMEWSLSHPRNYEGLKTCAQFLQRLNRLPEAARILTQAATVFPLETSSGSAWSQLAAIHKELGNIEEEKWALHQLAQVDDDASSAFLRLVELETLAENWPALRVASERLVAIKPLIPHPYTGLALAGEHLHEPTIAIDALKTLLTFNPPDSAGLHYRLAVQYQKIGENQQARKHALRALEIAPRYRDALTLLVNLQSSDPLAPDVEKSSVEDAQSQ